MVSNISAIANSFSSGSSAGSATIWRTLANSASACFSWRSSLGISP
ncbi:MAG: hypothetical protein QNJ72_04375 [Pleurocapsa sp. MO_226.B13]|nr:hypothetical protein [Pleurocapsa sp. MO_226.B13]